MESKFKAGDLVCYKTHTDICIGSVSPDIKHLEGTGLIFDGVERKIVPIFTSEEWAINFGHGVCPNTLHEFEDELMLFIGERKRVALPTELLIKI